MSNRPTLTIAPETLPGRARAPRKAHNRRSRLATQLWAAGPRRPRPLLDREPRRIPGLEVPQPSNISLTPQSTRLDLPPVPPRQRPHDRTTRIRPPTLTHAHRPPYQLRRPVPPRPMPIAPAVPGLALIFARGTRLLCRRERQPARRLPWCIQWTTAGRDAGDCRILTAMRGWLNCLRRCRRQRGAPIVAAGCVDDSSWLQRG